MRVAVPREVKESENRVAITPAGVHDLVGRGHEVIVETRAGAGSGIPDAEFERAGAKIAADADETWAQAELLVKVKEPVAEEYHRLRNDLVLFAYLHLAAEAELTRVLMSSGVTAIAYETVQGPGGSLPLLAPMSEIAGRLAPLVGAHTMLSPAGGPGVLLSGAPGTPQSHVVVLGGGVAGSNAARVALGLGARVTVLDIDPAKLRELDARHGGQVETLTSTPLAVAQAVKAADLVVGSVLIPGASAPKLVTDEMVASMKPGSVLVDIAVDQDGCFEDSRPTTLADPTFTRHGSILYCVGNMPGAVPVTATAALTAATLPYLRAIAGRGWREAAQADPGLARGVSVHAGGITSEPVASSLGLPHAPLSL